MSNDVEALEPGGAVTPPFLSTRASSAPTCGSCEATTGSGSTPSRSDTRCSSTCSHLLPRPRRAVRGRDRVARPPVARGPRRARAARCRAARRGVLVRRRASSASTWPPPRRRRDLRAGHDARRGARLRGGRRVRADRGRPAAARLRHGRGHDAAGGGHQRARGELHEGLLRGPGDGRAAPLQGQAEPPPARATALRAGRARRRVSSATRWSGGSAPHASPRASARSRSRSCAARRPRRRRRWSAERGRGRGLRSSIAEPRRPREPSRALPGQPAARARPAGRRGL